MKFPLSPHGGFPDWISNLHFTFQVNTVGTNETVASLRFTPSGYECDKSHLVYGIYFDVCVDSASSRYSIDDFIDPKQLRQLAFLLATPSANLLVSKVSGEVLDLEFGWKDRQLIIQGKMGTEDWGPHYLERLFQDYPFQANIHFKCGVAEESLDQTCKSLAKLLRAIDQVESNTPPTHVKEGRSDTCT